MFEHANGNADADKTLKNVESLIEYAVEIEWLLNVERLS